MTVFYSSHISDEDAVLFSYLTT